MPKWDLKLLLFTFFVYFRSKMADHLTTYVKRILSKLDNLKKFFYNSIQLYYQSNAYWPSFFWAIMIMIMGLMKDTN